LNQPGGQRLAGLDAVRFVCALIVVIGHNPPSWRFLGSAGHGAVLVAKLARDMTSGPAAVIVFFVISGFCIHWPHRGNSQPIGADYFLRRYIRIGAPLGAALLVSPYFGISSGELLGSVLWSLYCELIYYTIYPILLRIATRLSWEHLVVVAFAAATAWVVARPNPSGNYTSASVFSDSVIGLPCWLLGCLMAERKLPAVPSTRKIWLWRALVYCTSILALELRFHSFVHYDLSLNFFGILVMYWLSRELSYHQAKRPWQWLERAGAWSYSLYLFHLAGIELPAKLFRHWSEGAQWVVRTPITLVACYLFYLVFERPSHRLARLAAGAVRPRLASST